MNNMILASFILPTHDNSGNDLSPIHSGLQSELVDSFGGFTAIDSLGGWRAPDGKIMVEPGKRYNVAMVPDSADSFRRVVLSYGKAAHQIAMYAEIDGKPEFMDC